MDFNIILTTAVLLHTLQLPSMSKGQALQWQVNKSSEIIFGRSEMELICSGSACCTGSLRRWTAGPSSTVLMSNGAPSDSTKYEEILATNSFSLKFKSLELADFNLQYKCSIDFATSTQNVLLPTTDVFRYVPDVNNEIKIEKNLTGGNITLTANLTRVFPEPTCTATLEDSNITDRLVLTTYENTPVNFTIIEMNNIPYQCSNGRGNLFISCYVGSIQFTVIQEELCPISEMSTSIATERMTSINSSSEFSNTTLPMISGSTTTTSIETTNFDVNTQTNEIQTNTLRIISNSLSTYQNMFVTTTATDISGSFEIPIQTMTETFTMTDHTISSYNEIIPPSTFETSIVFPQTVSETSISLSADTFSDSLMHTILVNSGSLIATNSSELSILSFTIPPSYVGDSNIPSFSTLLSVQSLTTDITDSAFEITNVSNVINLFLTTDTVKTPVTIATVDTVLNSKKSASLLLSISENNSRIQEIDTNTESPLMSTTFIDQILYSSMIEEPSDLSETSLTLSKISVSSQLLSSIIDTMDNFIYSTNTLIAFYLDDTRHSFVNLTSVFKTFSPDYAASASTPLPYFIQSTYHSSLQTSEYYATIQTEFKSYATPSFYESKTNNAATEIYSKRKVTSAPPNKHISVMPSQTQLASMNDIQNSTNHFQSTYLEPYFQSTDEIFSSKDSEYVLSTLRSTSFLLSFNTNANASRVELSVKTTNMLIFETQSDIPTISADLSDFETTRLMTTIDFSNETILSMIKPSSQQKNTVNSYIEIDTSFKDSLFSSSHVSGSLTSNYVGLTTLSIEVFESMSSPPTNTVQSGLSEKNKIIIFISTTSAVVTIIVVIILIGFARMNMSKHIEKPRNEDDDISWSNSGSPSKRVCPDYSFSGKSIYPFLNTSSSSFKMYPYEHNWNDIV